MRTWILRATFLLAALTAVPAVSHAQGKVVVSHDEWYTGSCCFGANEKQFMTNSMNWFGLGSGSNVLIYSGNGFLTDGTFSSFLSGMGIGSTANAGASSGSFGSYGAIVVSGNPSMDALALVNYVLAGGNVFVIGGTGTGGSAGEAGYNNPFLNAFGLGFGTSYNNLSTVSTVGFNTQGPFGAALFTGVNSVYANNGNPVIQAASVSGVTNQVFYDANQNGVFGAAQVTVTPEPAALALFGTGLLALIPMARRRKKS
jgi:hypothetical protein